MSPAPHSQRRALALAALLTLIAGTTAATVQQDAASLLRAEIKTARPLTSITDGKLRIIYDDEATRLEIEELSPRPERQLTAGAWAPHTPADCFVVAEFDYGSGNRLGGRFGTFARKPSRASVQRVATTDGYRVLQLRYRRADSGYGGLRISLDSPEPELGTHYRLDASSFDTLSFWVRGSTDGAPARLRISDAAGADAGDATAIAQLRELVPAGRVTDQWQQVVVALDRLPAPIDPSSLDKLVIDPEGPGSGQIEIDRLALCRGTALPGLPAPRAAAEDFLHAAKELPGPGNATDLPVPSALWVWHTRDLLGSAEQRQRLAGFVARHRLARIYLQMPGWLISTAPETELPAAARELGALVTALSAAGAEVLALDGAPEYALGHAHDRVANAVANVVRYNELVGNDARQTGRNPRFTGVHYDVEPYLLPEFAGSSRSRVAAEYLAMLDRISGSAAVGGLWVEAAIPFWFDSVRLPREAHGRTEFTALSEAVIDRVDSVAVMDYRTAADGSNGTVALADRELAYAARSGKQVWVALETTVLPDEEQVVFGPGGGEGLPNGRLADVDWIVGVETEDGAGFYLVSSAQLSALSRHLAAGVQRDRAIRHWPVRRRSRLPATRLTFSDLGATRLHEVMRDSARLMARYPSFSGFAIHYYRPYARLLREAGAES